MLSAGDKLGPYEILTPIGAGGMGSVYRARDTRLDRTVAVNSVIVRIRRMVIDGIAPPRTRLSRLPDFGGQGGSR